MGLSEREMILGKRRIHDGNRFFKIVLKVTLKNVEM